MCFDLGAKQIDGRDSDPSPLGPHLVPRLSSRPSALTPRPSTLLFRRLGLPDVLLHLRRDVALDQVDLPEGDSAVELPRVLRAVDADVVHARADDETEDV